MNRTHAAGIFAFTPMLLAGSMTNAHQQAEDPIGRRSSLVQRPLPTVVGPLVIWPIGMDGPGVDDPAVFPDEYRTIDGQFNNLSRPWLGSAGQAFVRLVAPAYGDGVGLVPARVDGPSPRAISQAVADQNDANMPNSTGVSNLFWLWGQFLDHDLDETPVAEPIERFDIRVPSGDPWFDPASTGTATIALDRSGYRVVNGRREQVNLITAFIDASNVYGSDEAREAELRRHDGSGTLKTSPGDLLPFNINGFPNAPDASDPTLFLAGDVRCNEQVSLIAMHTLWVREHNHWASVVRAANPGLSGQDVYEHARAIVVGIVQSITYNEFLPILLGPDALAPYSGYNPDIDPGIANAFAAAGYRMGHTMLPLFLPRLDEHGREAPEGHLSLAQAFFVPDEIGRNGIDSVLRGVTRTHAQQFDGMLVGEVRNFLFGRPGAGGFDLASLNIQRGRDHGLPDYNTIRAALGFSPVERFEQVNPDPAVWERLALVYPDVGGIDPWVGLLAEPAAPGGMVGPTLRALLADQFTRARDGDRFWYQSYLPADLVALVEAQSMATVLRRNSGLGQEIGPEAFHAPEPCRADFDADGSLTLYDFLAFQTAYGLGDLVADIDGDGGLSVRDFLVFRDAFEAGCD